MAIVIFQPELRKALEQQGSRNPLTGILTFDDGKEETEFTDKTINEPVKATFEIQPAAFTLLYSSIAGSFSFHFSEDENFTTSPSLPSVAIWSCQNASDQTLNSVIFDQLSDSLIRHSSRYSDRINVFDSFF